MKRLVKPLDRGAVKKADDAFYEEHKELVKNGKREPLSGTDPSQETMRQEWRQMYEDAGGPMTETGKTASQSRADEAKKVDKAAKESFAATPAGTSKVPCPAAKGDAPPPASDAPPASQKKNLCSPSVTSCTARASDVKCDHGARGGTPKPGTVLQVVPEDELSADTMTFTANAASCGRVVAWTVSGAHTDSKTGSAYSLTVRGWPYRGLVGLTPLSRWAMRAAPNTYRVRSSLPCGSLSESFEVQAYPSDKIKHKVSPQEQPIFKAFEDYVINGFLRAFFGKKAKIEVLKGSFSVEAFWKEDKHSWNAFYAYDIRLGFDPLIKVEGKISLIDVIGKMVAIPAAATDWIQEYVGDSIYFSAAGEIAAYGKLVRSGPQTWTDWSFGVTGKIIFSFGIDIKLGDPKLLQVSAKGSAGISATARLGPKSKDSDPSVFLDGEFEGLYGLITINVCHGWYKFEEKYYMIHKVVLLSNYQAAFFSSE